MIKSIQKEYNKTPTIEYPCIQISKNSGLIVLFSEPCRGTILIEGHPEGIGWAHDGWSMGHFEPYNGSIELSNA